MNVQHYELEAFMDELKKTRVRDVRVQTLHYRVPIKYTAGNEEVVIPHVAYELILTAKMKDGTIIGYKEKIDVVKEFERRRNNEAKKKTGIFEQEVRGSLKKLGFNVLKGIYQKGG